MSAFRIEIAHDIAGCRATVPIQEEVWSGDVVVPPQLLLAVVRNGGFVALGHVDGDDRPAGFVFGFLGIYDYHFRHHSHMLAVRAPYRHMGASEAAAPKGGAEGVRREEERAGSGRTLAVALKEAQRDHCLDQGIDTIAWTMDPLEARNARFNFAKLGAFARTYERDLYGPMPDKLNEGLPSDRLYIEWRIATDHADTRLRGADPIPLLDDAERDGVRYLLRADGDHPGEAEPVGDDGHLLVEIPSDIQAIKARDRALAMAWRSAVREALEPAFAAGYAAVEHLRSADSSRGAYLLVRQPQHPVPPPAEGVAPPAGAGAEPRRRTGFAE